MSMKGKVAVVTGAGSGIGKAAACLLAKEGCKVAIVARREEKLEETLKEIQSYGTEGLIVAGDVSKEEDVKQLFQEVVSKWGDRIDYVVPNAGVNGVWAPIEDLKVEEFDSTIAINLRGTFMTIKYAVPHMKKSGGAIVVISSVNGTRVFSNTGATAYSTSKAGQVAMTKMLSVELAKYKIRVNAVCPGRIDSNIREEQTEERNLEGIKLPVEFPEGNIPLTGKEPGTSPQVAQLIYFLLSDNSSHVTGSEVWIDGAESLLKG